MNRVWLGTLGMIALVGSAPACIAVLDWDFEASPGAGGAGGASASTGTSVASGEGGFGGAGGSSGGGGGGGGAVDPCPGCYGLRFGDDKNQSLSDMAFASDGSLFFVGAHDGRLELDAANFIENNVATGTQSYLAKLDRFGTPQWITQPLDWVKVEGDEGQIDIANGTLAWVGAIDNNGTRDTFLEVRDVAAGRDVTKLRRVYGAASNDSLRSVALSPDGQTVYIAGAVVGQANAGTFANCPAVPAFDTMGAQNILVLAIDVATGNCSWARTFKGGNHVGGSISVVTGSDGSPFISGFFVSGTIENLQFTFPPVPVVQDPKLGLVGFILKLDKASGNLMAARGYAHGGFVSMAADRSTGTIMAGGAGMTEITFLGTTMPAATALNDGADNVILAFDENLNEKWASITGGPENQFCPQMNSDGAGRLYAACLTKNKIERGVVINCSTDRACSVLMPIQSATGALIGSEIKTFGETEIFSNTGKWFVTAATPTARAVGGSFTVPVRFWDDKLLDVTGAVGDYDIAVGKVELVP